MAAFFAGIARFAAADWAADFLPVFLAAFFAALGAGAGEALFADLAALFAADLAGFFAALPAALFDFAHRALCAAAILSRASGLSARLPVPFRAGPAAAARVLDA